MKRLLLLCLSLAGCATLPDQPDGWLCSLYYDPAGSSLLCNRIKNPEDYMEIPVSDQAAHGAKCMPLETFERYTSYVFDLRKELIRCRLKK